VNKKGEPAEGPIPLFVKCRRLIGIADIIHTRVLSMGKLHRKIISVLRRAWSDVDDALDGGRTRHCDGVIASPVFVVLIMRRARKNSGVC